MKTYLLTIEYDGTPYAGWQRQDNGPSVQAEVEAAFEKFCQQKLTLHVAGRTDAGVHALGQCAHVQIEGPHDHEKIREAVNFYLRDQPIRILRVEEKPEGFHARFSALKRHYLYRILNRPSGPALDHNRVWHVFGALDFDAMRAAAAHLVGHHDFTSFRATNCQADNPVRTLDQLDIERQGEEIHFRVSARSFLHHMVRNLVGTLVEVGKAKIRSDDVQSILEARDRTRAGPTAPACGLYFVKVDY